ncbi:barttin [Tiliqua scincoides]|uniref:barttin n=1 Tax=Tiliqua scincoides TaxID=71010 RepID=UPI0034622553
MADDKSFRYGFIILGFFLVMIGMFIMSVEKPQVYITFCTLGILIIAVGITWSMCQCYPKIRVISVDTESEKFLVKESPDASNVENAIPEKSSFQTPYTNQKEADAYEKSLPSYEQIQMKVVGTAESLGVQSALIPSARAGGCIQPVIEAKVDVHRDLESDGETYKDPVSQTEATRLYCQSERFGIQAPLASFHEEVDISSVESTSNSQCLQKFKDAPQFVPPTESRLRFKLPSYDDFALIDSLIGEGQDQSNEKTAPNQSNCSIPATARDDELATDLGPRPLEPRVKQNEDEDDMYYGIKEGPEQLTSVDPVFEPKD